MRRFATASKALALTIAVASQVSSFAYGSESSVGLTFHSSVPVEQRVLLSADLRSLSKMVFSTSTEGRNLTKLIELKDLDGFAIHNWIINRSRYVVGENFDVRKDQIIDGGEFKYELPTASRKMPPHALGSGENTDGKFSTDMINIGTIIYLHGKELGRLEGIDFDGTPLFFTSPRVGLIKIGGGLFNADDDIGDPASDAFRLKRLAILVHESRHSDGHGKTLGFKHVICPAGHDYEGLAGCDRSSNGPYALGSAFLSATIDTCENCTDIQKEALRGEAIDYAGRVVASDDDFQKIEKLQLLIGGNEIMIDTYDGLLNDKKTKKGDKPAIKKEISQLKKQNENYASQLVNLSNNLRAQAKPIDSEPEGQIMSINLEKSRLLLKSTKAPAPLRLNIQAAQPIIQNGGQK
jgi:hypothetical protein